MNPDFFTYRGAKMAFGEPGSELCRLTLLRGWEDGKGLAGWLLCNPSTADGQDDDPTVRRMIHFSKAAGCGGLIAVNLWPWRTPYPCDLWPAIADGRITPEMMAANHAVIKDIWWKAKAMFVAFGVEPPRRHAEHVRRNVEAFGGLEQHKLLCLGTSDDGWPLHPLARGKFAITNDRKPVPWAWPKG